MNSFQNFGHIYYCGSSNNPIKRAATDVVVQCIRTDTINNTNKITKVNSHGAIANKERNVIVHHKPCKTPYLVMVGRTFGTRVMHPKPIHTLS